MKSNNTKNSLWLRWILYMAITLTAISVLLAAIDPDRFISLGDPYHHTLRYAPQRALLPWLGVIASAVTTCAYHYVAIRDKK